MFAAIEAEFNAIVADVKSIPEKLEALVGLHAKAQALTQLDAQVSQIVEDASKTTPQKVQDILTAVGKI